VGLQAGHEDVLILRFACGRGGHRDDLVCPMGARQVSKLFGHRHRPRHGLWLQVLVGKFPFAEADDLSQFGQNSVRMVRMQTHQQEANRVRTNIDEGYRTCLSTGQRCSPPDELSPLWPCPFGTWVAVMSAPGPARKQLGTLSPWETCSPLGTCSPRPGLFCAWLACHSRRVFQWCNNHPWALIPSVSGGALRRS